MRILFIHGLASSGSYKMASSLRILVPGAEVIAPDVPLNPGDALGMLQDICEKERPDLVTGLSLGGFWAQKLRGWKKLLINPDFHPSRLLCTMIGENRYLSPRADGAVSFTVTGETCEAYRLLEETQFENLSSREILLTTGFFAMNDELVRCGDEFEANYPGRRRDYPGKHLPTYPEIKKYFLPEITG